MEDNTLKNNDNEVKNYYHSKDRKFTFLHLEFRKLGVVDILILLTFFIALTVHFTMVYYFPEKRGFGLYSISSLICYMTVTTPFGLRFRNVYFFMTWLALCIVFLLAKTTLAYLPLGTFLLYQILRLLFWKRHSKEFIPFELVRAPLEFSKKAFRMNLIRFVSKIEGRGGYKEDKVYMKWLVWLGFLLFMACLFGVVGIRFN